jgi:AcrR family transcriptional regulator
LNLGLLPPCREAGPKLHFFGEEHVVALGEIRQLRESGLSLRDIFPRVAKIAARPTVRASDQRGGLSERIIAQATTMFVRLGYERVRMEDLALALRISKPTIYRHFPSKQELFLRCVQAVRYALVSPEQRSRSAKREAAAHAEDRIRAVLENFEAYRGLARILATLAHDPDPKISRHARMELHDMITNVEPFLRMRQAAGTLRPMNMELLAYMLWGALMAAGDRMLLDDRHPLESVVETYKSFIEHGMLSKAT